jgi:hypothetical protein
MAGLGGGYSDGVSASSHNSGAIFGLPKRRAASQKSLFREMIATLLGSLDTTQKTASQLDFGDRF